MPSLQRSVLSTLSYHSIFEYPLTDEEIYQFLIADHSVSRGDVQKAITELARSKEIVKFNMWHSIPSSFFPLPSSLKKLRLSRKKISTRKFSIARRAAILIGRLPWVKLVAVTGALAMENASEDDDIDLMIVTAENRLWIVRPIITALITIFFKRRKPSQQCSNVTMQQFRDAICLNLWVDEEALEIPKFQRNLYAAHELSQMKPIVNKHEAYERMMWENRWGRKFLANTWKGFNRQIDKYTNRQIDKWNPLNILNNIAFRLQLQYMKSKMTNERVSLHSAFFHPGNRSEEVLQQHQQTLKSVLDTHQ